MLGPPPAVRAARSRPIRPSAASGQSLGVWARPDDESYLSAVIMTLAAANGQRVACAIATKGKQGFSAAWPAASIAAIRTRELERALRIVGVGKHYWLGSVDGECAELGTDRGAVAVAAVVERLEPTPC